MKVLITGANGFLGSWLTRRLLSDGHDVSVLIRKNSDLSPLSDSKCNYVYGDVTDKNSCAQALRGMNTVFHLAGLILYNPYDREKMERVNVGGTKNIIEACVENSVEKLVHLSSVCAIGASFDQNNILNENSPFNLSHLHLGYFETKRDAEALVVAATKNNQIKSVILNPTTIYGAGDARKGSRGTQLKVARGKFPFYTSGGANVVAVEDVVDGIISAWNKGRNGERYILCGENILIKDLFYKIARIAGVKPPSIYLPNPALMLLGKIGDGLISIGKKAPINSETAWVARLYHWFTNHKAKTELGFNCRSTDIAIENSIRWSKENGLI